ncbi:hypothetical protein QFC22_005900 [Naganishia vaughanmartiniae]|uniref:Uncharacterized protein n=1 Tax=Naganishia vaughanmartiniae TaxID=1424756 RepID=A0ACC2WRZ6_9TREE|nr:hypothetical protein QFC22_005900 [Naganishia vaughanmartiniae]
MSEHSYRYTTYGTPKDLSNEVGYYPAFARTPSAASAVHPISSATALFAALGGPTPPLTPKSPGYAFEPPVMSASLPFPATTGKGGSAGTPRAVVASLTRKATSRRSLKTYRKVFISLAAALSIFYVYSEVYGASSTTWSSFLLRRPTEPKTFEFNQPKLAHSQDHLSTFQKHHINAEDLATDAAAQAGHQGVSFASEDDQAALDFGYYAEDEMLEDGGETDEQSHRATVAADQMTPAEKQRIWRKKLERALDLVAKRRKGGAKYIGRTVTSLSDQNGLPDVYFEAINAHTEIDISHPDVTTEEVARLVNIVDHTRQVTLKTLIWYLARGMKLEIAKDAAEVDSLMKSIWSVGGGRGLELALKSTDLEAGVGTSLGERVFWAGWQDAAEDEGSIAIFSKASLCSYCPYSKRAKDIFTKYQQANPARIRPAVFELDRRSDGPIIQSLLKRLTGRGTVPNIIVDFVSIGGADEISLMDSEGSLRKLLAHHRDKE